MTGSDFNTVFPVRIKFVNPPPDVQFRMGADVRTLILLGSEKSQNPMTLRDHYGIIYRDLVATFHDFAWGSRQTRQACKTGLSCVLAVLLTYFLDIREAYWAGITTLVMTQPNVAASIRKGWMRGAGACCGCFSGRDFDRTFPSTAYRLYFFVFRAFDSWFLSGGHP